MLKYVGAAVAAAVVSVYELTTLANTGALVGVVAPVYNRCVAEATAQVNLMGSTPQISGENFQKQTPACNPAVAGAVSALLPSSSKP